MILDNKDSINNIKNCASYLNKLDTSYIKIFKNEYYILAMNGKLMFTNNGGYIIYKIDTILDKMYINIDLSLYSSYRYYISIHIVNKRTNEVEKWYRNRTDEIMNDEPGIPTNEENAIDNLLNKDVYLVFNKNYDIMNNIFISNIYASLLYTKDYIIAEDTFYEYYLINEYDESFTISRQNGIYYNNNSYNYYPNSYDSYFIYIDEDCYIYPSNTSVASGNYAISLYNGQTVDSSNYIISKRINIEQDENSLPTKENKLYVNANTTIVISTKRNLNGVYLYICKKYKKLPEDILMSSTSESIIDKKIITEINKTLSDQHCVYSNDHLYLYTPTSSGYIRIDFGHIQSQQSNADNWKVRCIDAVDFDYSLLTNITITGEIEMALHLKGRPDYIGGEAHGSERLINNNSILFFIDGLLTDITTITNKKYFKTLIIKEFTNCYDPLDETTIVATHYKEYIFEGNKLTLNQQINWLGEYENTDSYMCMWTPKKSPVTNYIYTDTDPLPYELILDNDSHLTNGFTSKARDIAIYGENSGVFTRVSIPKYSPLQNVVNVFNLRDNNSNANGYNKCYFYYTNGDTVHNGDVWKTQSIFEYYYNKPEE